MSYDDWLGIPYEMDNEPPEDAEQGGCAVCGVSIRWNQMYCGDSCEQAEAEGWGDMSVEFTPTHRLTPSTYWERRAAMRDPNDEEVKELWLNQS